MQSMKVRYDSPTIALQIMPEEFTKFCSNLEYYMGQRLMEYTNISQQHQKYLKNMYDGPIGFPIGICGDILVAFQHFNTFQEAKEKWDRRKARIDYDHLNFVFVLDYQKYKQEAQDFANAKLPNSFIFCRGFDIDGPHYNYTVPEGLCFLDVIQGRYIFERGFNREDLCC